MKKWISLIALVLLTTFVFTGCMPEVIYVPDAMSIGESKTFEKGDIKLLLTEKFEEKTPREGFYALYDSYFAGVNVMRESFSLADGVSSLSLEQYTKNVIENNKFEGVTAQNKDDLWYFIYENDEIRGYVFTYKGSDAFWFVEYVCMHDDTESLEDLFFLWANAVEVK